MISITIITISGLTGCISDEEKPTVAAEGYEINHNEETITLKASAVQFLEGSYPIARWGCYFVYDTEYYSHEQFRAYKFRTNKTNTNFTETKELRDYFQTDIPFEQLDPDAVYNYRAAVEYQVPGGKFISAGSAGYFTLDEKNQKVRIINNNIEIIQKIGNNDTLEKSIQKIVQN